MIKYITTRTPLRVSFVGGGTDFYDYYKYNGGQVISGAINRYVYVTVKRHSDLYKEKFRLNYSITETALKIENIKNEITRACLKLLKINFPYIFLPSLIYQFHLVLGHQVLLLLDCLQLYML